MFLWFSQYQEPLFNIFLCTFFFFPYIWFPMDFLLVFCCFSQWVPEKTPGSPCRPSRPLRWHHPRWRPWRFHARALRARCKLRCRSAMPFRRHGLVEFHGPWHAMTTWNGLVMCLGDRNMKDHGRIKSYKKQRQCEKETSMWDSGYYMVLHLFHPMGPWYDRSNWWGHELGLASTCGETNPMAWPFSARDVPVATRDACSFSKWREDFTRIPSSKLT